jgi:hypothetical protein
LGKLGAGNRQAGSQGFSATDLDITADARGRVEKTIVKSNSAIFPGNRDAAVDRTLALSFNLTELFK